MRKETGLGNSCGSFIVDRGGTVLGFDLGMEAITGWPAVEVVGRHKDATATVAIAGGGRAISASLFDGEVPWPSETVRLEMRINCRDGRSLDVEAVATRAHGSFERVAVTVQRVLARSESGSARGDWSRRDEVTGLMGREAFLKRLDDVLARAAAEGKPVALILADVDHLRRVNDRMGHVAGNEVLKKVGAIIRATVDDDDLASRLEDDDFALILPGAGRGEARQVAARLRSTVERFRFFDLRDGSSNIPVTLSLGAASYPADTDNASDLLGRARDALQEARSFGRNRVWCYLRRPRVPLQVPVYFDGMDSALLGFSLDLSPSGIFVQTRVPIDIGMRCALAFPLPGGDGNVHAIGRVVRTVPAEPIPTGESRFPGMGIEFERLGSPDRRALESFVHQQESTTRRPENSVLSVS